MMNKQFLKKLNTAQVKEKNLFNLNSLEYIYIFSTWSLKKKISIL